MQGPSVPKVVLLEQLYHLICGFAGYSLVRPLLALRISLAGKDHPGIRYEPDETDIRIHEL